MEHLCLRAPDGLYSQARDLADQIIEAAPTAVIVFDDLLAHGVLDGLAAHQVRVPQDIELLGCDDALPIVAGKRLSTVSMPTARAANEAVRLLFEPEMSAKETGTRLEIPGTLKYRDTTCMSQHDDAAAN